MANRLKALFMLLIVGLVLPVAGSPQRFCMRQFTLIAPGERCPACNDMPSCDCDGTKDPSKPGCMTAAKIFPDALTPDHFVFSAPAAMPLPMFEVSEPKSAALVPNISHRMHMRGPPGNLPLYLLKRALLL